MAVSRYQLATLIVTLVLLTLLVAFFSASLVIWIAADWERYAWGLELTLRIMWGTWLVLFAAALLTYATFVGWHFRKAHPGEGPRALAQAIARGITPAAWLKTGATSFTITVVLVSLLGVSVLASVLIWIIGDWEHAAGALWLSLKIVWGTLWVLCIATVLVRISIFYRQRKNAGLTKKLDVEPEAEKHIDKEPESENAP